MKILSLIILSFEFLLFLSFAVLNLKHGVKFKTHHPVRSSLLFMLAAFVCIPFITVCGILTLTVFKILSIALIVFFILFMFIFGIFCVKGKAVIVTVLSVMSILMMCFPLFYIILVF